GLVLGVSGLFLSDAADHARRLSVLAGSRHRLRGRRCFLRRFCRLFPPVAARKAGAVFLAHPSRPLSAPQGTHVEAQFPHLLRSLGARLWHLQKSGLETRTRQILLGIGADQMDLMSKVKRPMSNVQCETFVK